MNNLLNKLITILKNLLQYIMADRLLLIWIPFLLSISILGGIVFPIYLITFFIDHKDPQFFEDLYHLEPKIYLYNKYTDLNSLSEKINELIKEYNEQLTNQTNDQIQTQKQLNKEESSLSNNEIKSLNSLEKEKRRLLYIENCKDNYDNVAKVLLYLSLTFVIIATFKSF